MSEMSKEQAVEYWAGRRDLDERVGKAWLAYEKAMGEYEAVRKELDEYISEWENKLREPNKVRFAHRADTART